MRHEMNKSETNRLKWSDINNQKIDINLRLQYKQGSFELPKEVKEKMDELINIWKEGQKRKNG